MRNCFYPYINISTRVNRILQKNILIRIFKIDKYISHILIARPEFVDPS